MKHLGNCTATEFIRQSFPAKKAVEKWLKLVGIESLRGLRPDKDKLIEITETMTDDEKAKAKAENHKVFRSFLLGQVSELFDKALGEHPDETLEVIAALCFTDPEHIDEYPASDYMAAVVEMANSEVLGSFFGSCYSMAVKAIVGI